MKLRMTRAALLLLVLSAAARVDAAAALSLPSILPVSVLPVAAKKSAIKIYPNPSTTGTVRVVSNTSGNVNFYIFALDGTLLHQAVIGEKEKHKVTNLKKGVYTYDVFYNDEGIEHGQLIVK